MDAIPLEGSLFKAENILCRQKKETEMIRMLLFCHFVFLVEWKTGGARTSDIIKDECSKYYGSLNLINYFNNDSDVSAANNRTTSLKIKD